MIRNLYFWLVARRHIGEPVCTGLADGVLLKAGPLGFTVETPDRCDFHASWHDIDYLKTGARLVRLLERARARAEELRSEHDEDDEPQPAIFGDELRRMLEEEPA
jgi:hypothetical protein